MSVEVANGGGGVSQENWYYESFIANGHSVSFTAENIPAGVDISGICITMDEETGSSYNGYGPADNNSGEIICTRTSSSGGASGSIIDFSYDPQTRVGTLTHRLAASNLVGFIQMYLWV